MKQREVSKLSRGSPVNQYIWHQLSDGRFQPTRRNFLSELRSLMPLGSMDMASSEPVPYCIPKEYVGLGSCAQLSHLSRYGGKSPEYPRHGILSYITEAMNLEEHGQRRGGCFSFVSLPSIPKFIRRHPNTKYCPASRRLLPRRANMPECRAGILSPELAVPGNTPSQHMLPLLPGW